MQSLFQYFEGTRQKTHFEKRTLSARLRSLLHEFNEHTSWSKISEGPLIVIADGLIEFFKGEKYTIYFILIRSATGSQAVILPPFLKIGGENSWHEAFATIPQEISSRIMALACDGNRGLISLAEKYHWILQRCHFHLLARIAHNASFGPLNKTKGLGLRIKNLVKVVLYHRDSYAILLALEALKNIQQTISSPHFKSVISGFLKNYHDYRSYLQYPEYFLPTTSNSAEYLIGRIRDLQYRARGFRTPESLFSWIMGYCKFKKSVTCRGKIQPN